ncbi:MAG: HAMP domain-containing histidine kinase [Parasporobacterium sp.]|nr:HAMP domain-containing histidine kinase [Parasporobacterium sp.]
MGVTENKIIETRTKNVSAQFSMLSNLFYSSSNSDTETDKYFSTLADDMAGVFLSRVQVINRDFTIISDTYQLNKGKLCISAEVNECFNGVNQAYTDKKNQCIVLTQAIKDPSTGRITHVLFATSSIADIFTAMDSIRTVLLATSIILVVALIALAIFASVQLSKPFRQIEDTIEHIGEGGNVETISISGGSEIQAISGSFNTMLKRINQLETSRQEFVSNVSHELKTPMTSMKVLAESLIGQQGVPEELYQEFLTDIVNELDRENNIISDLLTLVKMDSTGMELNVSQVNINEMIEAQLKLARPLAKEKNIELVLESFTPVIAEVDETKFSMCISNLVVNAIKYNNVDGWVHVSLNADKTYFYVKVQDNGFGIPEESLDHIFDRFYRVDKARDRATGGTGLGLAITKSIVLAHNGTIKVYSQVDKGTTFTMQIPLTYLKKQG